MAVRNCPKPPPTRISLTLAAIRTAVEVWMVVAGEGKAGAVAMAFGGAGEVAVPAAGAVGTSRTLWLMDRAAASRLPSSVIRPGSRCPDPAGRGKNGRTPILEEEDHEPRPRSR